MYSLTGLSDDSRTDNKFDTSKLLTYVTLQTKEKLTPYGA